MSLEKQDSDLLKLLEQKESEEVLKVITNQRKFRKKLN